MRAWRPAGRLWAPWGPRGRPGPSKTASERLLGGLLAALGAFLGPSWRLLGLSWPSRGAPGGHSWGWGEKLKLLQQQASLLFKASLREA